MSPYMSTPSGLGSAHILEGSSNVHINNSQFQTNIHGSTFEYQRILDAEVALNAILNAGGRADEVQCFPGTREEVISKAERWMTASYREDRRIFWLSGPAGAGKSAIVQTLGERCIERGAPMANFFFFRADASRNHSRPVVATLLRQLMKSLPGLKALVIAIIAEDALIFKTSLREQFATLIDAPIRKIREATPNAPPIILLIDGLDECDSRSDLDNATLSEQRILLNALHELAICSDSSFVLLVSSRVEPHIVMAFNSIGRHQDSIYLDDEYRPEQDIRLFITSEISKIRRTHSLGQLLSANWPSNTIINTIVERSSGQFIYAATVARFIANSPESPAFTVELVLNARPSHDHSPFAELDAIYMFILARSKHWERVSEIIALNSILYGRIFPPSSLGYSAHEVASFFSDLTSIIKAEISDDDVELTFYHASFHDFIHSAKRAGRFHIDLASYAKSLHGSSQAF